MLQLQSNWYPGWKLWAHIPLVRRNIEKFTDEVSADVPSLHEQVEALCENRYGSSELEMGWFVGGGGDGGLPSRVEATRAPQFCCGLGEPGKKCDQQAQWSFSNKLFGIEPTTCQVLQLRTAICCPMCNLGRWKGTSACE